MEDDPLDHWTDEDEAAFQEYLKAHPEFRPMAPWKAIRWVRLPLPDEVADDMMDDLLRAAFE